MTSTKDTSKRQARREQMRRKGQRERLIFGLLIVLVILVVALIVYSNNRKSAEVASSTPATDVVIPPAVTRPSVEFNATGNPDAPIRIDEYSDFQCPYCGLFYKTTEMQLVNAYVTTGKVYFIFNTFGEFIGPESAASAEAAYCAGDQGKFWEMHDILFENQNGENQGGFADSRLMAFAEKLGLKMSDFQSCFNADKYKDRINQDGKNGIASGVKATPSFVLSYTVNGEKKTELIEGALPFDEFKQKIDAALAEMGQQ
jgi:protein-disulfide isomerase